MKKIIGFILIAVTLFSAITFASCGSNNDAEKTIDEWTKTYTAGSFGIIDRKDPFVVLEVEGFGSIRLELFPSVAPISVENFVRYVKEGFYDGMVFHRVIQDFMIQTGGFVLSEGNGVQKVATHPTIQGEFAANGVRNDLAHKKGVLSMARGNDPNSGSSQFFICTATPSWLDGQYAAFGRVIDEESMSVVAAIGKVQTESKYLYSGSYPVFSDDVPVVFPVIKKATLVQIKR